VEKIHEVLFNNFGDTDRKIICDASCISSKSSIPMQVCDILTGAIAADHRKDITNQAKLDVIGRIKTMHGSELTLTTHKSAKKFNLFHWKPGYRRASTYLQQ
jgi:hypothetical protein